MRLATQNLLAVHYKTRSHGEINQKNSIWVRTTKMTESSIFLKNFSSNANNEYFTYILHICYNMFCIWTKEKKMETTPPPPPQKKTTLFFLSNWEFLSGIGGNILFGESMCMYYWWTACSSWRRFNMYENIQWMKKAKYVNKHFFEILNTQLKLWNTQMNEKGVSNIPKCWKN